MQLLQQLGLEAFVCSADIDESVITGEAPADYVMRLASTKARSVAVLYPDAVVLGADTVVTVAGQLLGKPESMQHAFEMWTALSGRWHKVMTGVSTHVAGETRSILNVSEVLFSGITEKGMLAYWNTGEPADKAGGYAIQGYAARWIREIRGSYSGIMGLPLFETAELLNEAGIETLL